MYTDTPVPQEEPAGQNPPDGAMIDYYPEKQMFKLMFTTQKFLMQKGKSDTKIFKQRHII